MPRARLLSTTQTVGALLALSCAAWSVIPSAADARGGGRSVRPAAVTAGTVARPDHTVIAASGSCSGQRLGNPGFETGTAAPWSTSTGVVSNSTSEPAHAGSWDAWLDGYGTTHTDTLSQTVTIPAGCHAVLSYWLHIDTAETTTTTAYDTLTVKVNTTTLAKYSNLNHNSGYAQHSHDLSSYAGQTVTISFTATEDSSLQTSFVLDDITVTLS